MKTPHQNRLDDGMLDAILTTRAGLKRLSKCHDYEFPQNVLNAVGKFYTPFPQWRTQGGVNPPPRDHGFFF